jgi:hypothetical protein
MRSVSGLFFEGMNKEQFPEGNIIKLRTAAHFFHYGDIHVVVNKAS